MEIIAIGVANLTDARYFAAMGVDWIGFEMGPNSPLSIEHVVAFADWVEGPKFFLDVSGRTEDQIAEILASFQADGLMIGKEMSLPHYAGKIIKTIDIDNTGDSQVDALIYRLEEWQEKVANEKSEGIDEGWVKVRDKDEYQSLKTGTGQISGIVVSGSDEQKVGIKSYEDLDELFEVIRS